MIKRRCLRCNGQVYMKRGGFAHLAGPPIDLHKPEPGCIKYVGLRRAYGRPHGEAVDIVFDLLRWQ